MHVGCVGVVCRRDPFAEALQTGLVSCRDESGAEAARGRRFARPVTPFCRMCPSLFVFFRLARASGVLR